MLSLKGGRKERTGREAKEGEEWGREEGRMGEGKEWMSLCVHSNPLILSLI